MSTKCGEGGEDGIQNEIKGKEQMLRKCYKIINTSLITGPVFSDFFSCEGLQADRTCDKFVGKKGDSSQIQIEKWGERGRFEWMRRR